MLAAARRAKRLVRRMVNAADRRLYSAGIRSADRLTLPDFLGLGPGQTGSTWLYRHLSEHPDLFLPSRKELNYFDRKLHEWPLAAYASWFEPGRDRIAGEVTPGYSILTRERIAFVRKVMPDVRLILTVRDPVERSWSAARRVLQKLGTTPEQLGDAELFEYLRTEWSYRPRVGPVVIGDYEPGLLEGHYCRIIDNWREEFPPEQLLVVFFGQIVEDPEGFLGAVCRHVGVRTDFRWDPKTLRQRVNPNPRLELPERVRSFLEDLYRDEIERLQERFGDSARRWLRDPARPA